MGEKDQHITIEDLAGMIQRNFEAVATRADLDRLETNVSAEFVAIKGMIEKIPELVVDHLMDWTSLKTEHDRMKKIIREKLGVEV